MTTLEIAGLRYVRIDAIVSSNRSSSKHQEHRKPAAGRAWRNPLVDSNGERL
jgi:hypothetical protein